MKRCQRAFTMLEMLAVVAVVAALATLALPSFQAGVVRRQVLDAAPLVDVAKLPVATAWAATQVLPADNAAAGLPAPDRMVGNHVSAVTVENGAIHVTFGNGAHGILAGRILTFRPAVVEDAPVVPVAWVCGHAAVPANMVAKGENRTSIPAAYLPINCHPPAP